MPKQSFSSVQATLTGLRAKYTLQESIIRQAAADLEAKTAQAEFAKLDAERYRALALNEFRYPARTQKERRAVDQAAAGGRGLGTGSVHCRKTAVERLAALTSTEAAAAVAQAQADLTDRTP